MKIFLKILYYLSVNSILFTIAVFLYLKFTLEIIQTLSDEIDLEGPLFIVMFFIFIIYILTTFNIKFSFGIFSIIYSLIILVVHSLNNLSIKEGNYVSYKLEGIEWSENKCYVKINNPYSSEIEVSYDKMINIDSVQARIDVGFLGWRIKTKNIRIKENENCSPYSPVKQSDSISSTINEANSYLHNRCFTEAYTIYSKIIDMNIFNEDLYFNRGLISLHFREYDKAILDFYSAELIYGAKLEEKTMKDFKELDLNKKRREITKNLIETKNTKDILSSMSILNIINNLDVYQRGITFCAKKLNNKESYN